MACFSFAAEHKFSRSAARKISYMHELKGFDVTTLGEGEMQAGHA